MSVGGDGGVLAPCPESVYKQIQYLCNEHGTIYAISSDFGDRMTTQSMGLMILLSEYF